MITFDEYFCCERPRNEVGNQPEIHSKNQFENFDKSVKIFFSKRGPFDVGATKKIFCDFSNFQNFFLKSGLNGT